MLKEGMSIEARHVKRKHLSTYLDGDFLKRERKSTENHNNFNKTVLASRKRLSNEKNTTTNSVAVGDFTQKCKQPIRKKIKLSSVSKLCKFLVN